MSLSATDESAENRFPHAISLMFLFAVAVAGVAITAYILYFGSYLGAPASKDPAAWGQFGDYIGGLLNPIVALCALGLLATSVIIQRRTLALTKQELLALREGAALDRFSSQFASLLSVLTSLKNNPEHARRLSQAADAIIQHVRRRGEHKDAAPNVAGYLDQCAAIAIPIIALAQTLADLVISQQLPHSERERYLNIIRSLMTTDDGIISLAASMFGWWDLKADREQDLLRYMHPLALLEMRDAMQDHLDGKW